MHLESILKKKKSNDSNSSLMLASSDLKTNSFLLLLFFYYFLIVYTNYKSFRLISFLPLSYFYYILFYRALLRFNDKITQRGEDYNLCARRIESSNRGFNSTFYHSETKLLKQLCPRLWLTIRTASTFH